MLLCEDTVFLLWILIIAWRICDMRIKSYGILIGIGLLGAIVRLLGPIRHVALGQTDGYAHLQFLRDWIETGHLRHPGYPPGYYWVIGMPTRLLQLDPYDVVRFGGAVFGVALIYAVFLLGRHCFDKKAGVWAAFFVSAFPAFWLLQKTGVGAYPSQLGLVLTVLVLWSWDTALRGAWRWFGLFGLALALLALSVPVMLIDVALLLLLDGAVRTWRREIPIAAWMISVSVLFFVCVGLIVVGVYRFEYLFAETLRILAGLSASSAEGMGLVWQVVLAYVSPARGLPSSGGAAAAALLVLVIVGGLARVLWKTNSAARMLVIWSVLAWAQAVLGVFQFPLYIRAGWHLLIAIALLGGWVVARCLDFVNPWVSRLGKTLLIASALVTIRYPPMPVPHLSPAENDLVSVLQSLSRWADDSTHDALPELRSLLHGEEQLMLWTRAFNAFPGHQGDPVWAFLESKKQIQIMSLDAGMPTNTWFDTDIIHVGLFDDRVDPIASMPVMQMVNPDLVRALHAHADRTRAVSSKLRRAMEKAGEQQDRSLITFSLPEGLDVYVLSRRMRVE